MKTPEEYRRKIELALLEAVFEASKQDGVVVLDADTITRACMSTVAFVAAKSSACATPTKTKVFCLAAARDLRERISLFQKMDAAGELDFVSMYDPNKPKT